MLGKLNLINFFSFLFFGRNSQSQCTSMFPTKSHQQKFSIFRIFNFQNLILEPALHSVQAELFCSIFQKKIVLFYFPKKQ